MESISFRTGKLFPFQFLLLGGVLLLVGLASFIVYPLLSPFIVITGVAIITAETGLEINKEKHIYKEYYRVLFIKFGKENQFDGAEKIFINARNSSQHIYTRVTVGSTIRNAEHVAYLKLLDGTKLLLANRKNKQNLLDQLTPLAKYLEIHIQDNT